MLRRLAGLILMLNVLAASFGPVLADDAVWPAAVTKAEVQRLLQSLPASTDAWEAARPKLIRWLQDQRGAQEPIRWVLSDEVLEGEDHKLCAMHCEAEVNGATRPIAYGGLKVPAQHVGRGPAVLLFSDVAAPREGLPWSDNVTKSSVMFKASDDLTQAGFVLLSANQVSKPTCAAEADRLAVQFLMERPEVDPDRVAIVGLGNAARRAWRVAALDERIAAVVSLGTPAAANWDDEIMFSLIAPRPHRLAVDTAVIRDRQASIRHWITGPQRLYELHDLPALFSTRLGARFSTEKDSAAWQDMVTWLKDEL